MIESSDDDQSINQNQLKNVFLDEDSLKNDDQIQMEKLIINDEIDPDVTYSCIKRRFGERFELFIFRNIKLLFVIGSFMPLFALLFDTLYPMTTDYSYVTRVICNQIRIKPNFWPTLSGTIGYGSYTLKIWLILILGHAPLRFIGAYYLFKNYMTSFYAPDEYQLLPGSKHAAMMPPRFKKLLKFNYVINVLEILALCALAIYMYFFFNQHRYGVALFMFYSFIYIITNLVIEYKLKTKNMPNCFDSKLFFATVFTICWFSILITYFNLCVPIVSSLFGLSETGLVASNIFFHFMSYFGIKDYSKRQLAANKSLNVQNRN